VKLTKINGILDSVQGKVNLEISLRDIESSTIELSHSVFPITFSWHELNYDVMIPSLKIPRTILSYVSGWGEPNDMIALLGNHGAGKTTLLNCLAGNLGHASCLNHHFKDQLK
jgi:ABC-type multidrug transport system ATPase subunit